MLQILRIVVMVILYQDDDVIAVHKPAGQLVIPGRGLPSGEPLVAELERNAGRKIYVVHRLDRGASGIVLFAKNAAAHRHLSLQFERREVHKCYRVLVQGRLESDGSVDQPLHSFGSGRMGIQAAGKPSVTEYHVREHLKSATLLDVAPHTGRRHQIRVHLYSLGHPVMGDPLYGHDRPVGGITRLMLHASDLEWLDSSGNPKVLHADPPPDFEEILNRLRT
jgi:tRNA pseudouridine32 synthase/23S rRNA pseudouridine746 synthase